MLLRILAAVLAVLGLAAIALGVASATVWRPADTLTATATSADGTTLITTAPGVLELADPPVTVRATADDGAEVVIALGRDTDVAAWVGDDPHTVVTGLQDTRTLATQAGDAGAEGSDGQDGAAADEDAEATPTEEATDGPSDGEADPAAPDPAGSDLWVQQARGEGAAEMVWTPVDGRWTLLAASAGETAGPVTLELSWPQTVSTPWFLPGVVGGAVLLLLAALLALAARRSTRRARAGDAAPAVAGTGAHAADATGRTDGEDPR